MDKTLNFVKLIYPIAKQLEASGGLNSLFTTAQAALESGWGDKSIGNNIFGITIGSTWKGNKKLVVTTEYFNTANVKFKLPEEVISINKVSSGKYEYKVKRFYRDYNTIYDSLIDHENILKKSIYSDAWPYRNDPYKYSELICDNVGSKYATAPNYASLMKSMINSVKTRVIKLKI